MKSMTQLPLKYLLDAKGNVREDCQLRESTNHELAREYGEDMRLGCEFPPVVVYFDSAPTVRLHDLAGGFHRSWGALYAFGPKGSILADVRQGTRRDAILFAASDNSKHGWRRTREDKRKAVAKLLDDAEWGRWSPRRIADACGVSANLVSDMIDERRASGQVCPGAPKVHLVETRIGKDGRSYQTARETGSRQPPLDHVAARDRLAAALREVPAGPDNDLEIVRALLVEAEARADRQGWAAVVDALELTLSRLGEVG